ncbi:UNVERIFIED_CONTAM: hypothetical protein Q9R58_18770 [Methylobacteriaceae bacterium AG10]|nr:hypothetical protein [Methylobacteriaceae bacterium AG10]
MLQDQSRNRTPMPAAQQAAKVASPEPGPARAEAGIARILSEPPHGDQPPADLIEACDWAIRHSAWIDSTAGRENWDDARVKAECDKVNTVWYRARWTPSWNPNLLAAKSRLLLADLEGHFAQFPDSEPDQRDRLTMTILRDAIAMPPLGSKVSGLSADDRDAELIEIGRQWPRLVAEYEGLSKRSADMVGQHPEPKRPKELTVYSFDQMHGFPLPAGIGGAFMPYGAKEIDELRAVPRVAVYLAKKGDGFRRSDGTILSIHEAAQQRAEAIIAAWDRWQAELEAYRAEHGLPAFDTALDLATKAYDAAILQARALPAHTPAGLLTKAKIAAEICRTQNDEDEDPLDETAILKSVLADVLRIGEQSDPVFAGIANTRKAIGNALAVLDQHHRDNRDADLPPAWFDACNAAEDAFELALSVTPTTQAGWQELARLTIDLCDDLGLDAKEEALPVLQRMAANKPSADVRCGQ